MALAIRKIKGNIAPFEPRPLEPLHILFAKEYAIGEDRSTQSQSMSISNEIGQVIPHQGFTTKVRDPADTEGTGVTQDSLDLGPAQLIHLFIKFRAYQAVLTTALTVVGNPNPELPETTADKEMLHPVKHIGIK